MTLALTFYSIGTWGEHIEKRLRLWHIVFFILGLCADSFGTALMTEMADPAKKDLLHGITGAAALFLMAVHALWAILTYWKGSPKAKRNFQQVQRLCLGLLADTLRTGHRTGHEVRVYLSASYKEREAAFHKAASLSNGDMVPPFAYHDSMVVISLSKSCK